MLEDIVKLRYYFASRTYVRGRPEQIQKLSPHVPRTAPASVSKKRLRVLGIAKPGKKGLLLAINMFKGKYFLESVWYRNIASQGPSTRESNIVRVNSL